MAKRRVFSTEQIIRKPEGPEEENARLEHLVAGLSLDHSSENRTTLPF